MNGPLDPQAISFREGSMARICRAASAAFSPYSAGGHVTDLPGPVHLIAQAPVLHVVGLGNPVLAAQVAPLSSLFDIAIFHQCCGFFRRSRAEIQAHERHVPTCLHHAMNSLVPN